MLEEYTKTYMEVVAVGRDRPGVVQKISREIRKNGGNIELQRSTKMAGDFALILLFSLKNAEEEKVNSTIKSLNQLSDESFFIQTRKAISDLKRPPGYKCGDLIAEGADQMGIIDTISLLLFQNQINIEAMNYDIINAPMTGTPLFRMEARVSVPKSVDITNFKKKLINTERDFNIDIIFRFPVPC